MARRKKSGGCLSSFLVLFFIYFISVCFITMPVYATPGGLRKKSIKTCPDGNTYGQHLSEGQLHWHKAVNNGSWSSWTAEGEPLAGDPCPNMNKQATTTTAYKTTTSQKTSTSKQTTTRTTTSTNTNTTTTTSEVVIIDETTTVTTAEESNDVISKGSEINESTESNNNNSSSSYVAAVGGLTCGLGAYAIYKSKKNKK